MSESHNWPGRTVTGAREENVNRILDGLLYSFVLLTPGCATLVKGANQTVTIATDPAGASCTLTRDAKPLAIINPTPGSVPVEKARETIAIACVKKGYLEAAGNMASEFQPMTFGNVLFGGIVGVVVDAASGAMHQYPDMVTITLIPEEFATPGERDDFFDRMRSALAREVTEAKDRIVKMCARGNCDRELSAADAGAREKLAEIEQHRAQTRLAVE
jgi:hypothetical protein